jgi:hypothetical protein
MRGNATKMRVRAVNKRGNDCGEGTELHGSCLPCFPLDIVPLREKVRPIIPPLIIRPPSGDEVSAI